MTRESKTLQAQAKILEVGNEDLSNNIFEIPNVSSCHQSNQRFKILTFCYNQYIDNNNRLNTILQFGFGFSENSSFLEIDQVVLLTNTIH